MPFNIEVSVRCLKWDCYWNMGKDKRMFRKNNCAHSEIVITDKLCKQFIPKDEAFKRLGRVV